jgi:hypothetical protein
MPNTYTELLKTTVGTAASSVTLDLTGISGYTDLALVCNAKVTTGTPTIRLQFNSDTGNNYSATILYGDGSAAGSVRVSNQASINQGLCTTEFGTTQIHLMNYSNATTNKTTLCDYRNIGPTYGEAGAITGLWRNTAAITSITIFPASSTFEVGSTFSLYGIANADQGAAKATGGIITEDATYWYHTFGASGTFTPKQALTCDYLVVAGGGGASLGGGGAGGLRYLAAQSLTTTGYAVTIGAGGAGSINNGSPSANASNGSNSVFNALTSTGGGGGGGTNAALKAGNGGSGGGAGAVDGTPGDGTSGQGNNGGTIGGFTGANYPGGGGGGAGVVGGNATGANTPGVGGNGVNTYSSFATATSTGDSGYYAGGGGGGIYNSSSTPTGSVGGLGGGGRGSQGVANAAGLAGTANTGGGAGGGNAAGLQPGGSGIVIVRYAK